MDILFVISSTVGFCVLLWAYDSSVKKPIRRAREAEIKRLELLYKDIKARKKAGNWTDADTISLIVREQINDFRNRFLW